MERVVALAGLCLVLTPLACEARAWTVVAGPVYRRAYPCKNNTHVTVRFAADLPPRYSSFYVDINMTLPADSVIKVTFDADVHLAMTVKSDDGKFSKISFDGESFVLRFAKELPSLSFLVQGSHPRLTPHLKSLTVNRTEYCKSPDKAFLEEYAAKDTVPMDKEYPLKTGKITELPVDGPAKPGDWPWHTAIFLAKNIRITELYLFGGTLISKRFVLTAYTNVNCYKVEHLLVKFGKHRLPYVGKEIQEKRVESVFTQGFVLYASKNNIALLKTVSDVQFTDVVQPACLWHRRPTDPPPGTIVGTLAGWGESNDRQLSYSELLQVSLPMVDRATCVASNPDFFGQVVTANKFCAGYRNQGTAPCNGDSGGGFMVFLPDKQTDNNGTRSGAWYVRGVMSKVTPWRNTNPEKCDENQYVVFTDTEPFADWIEMHLDDI